MRGNSVIGNRLRGVRKTLLGLTLEDVGEQLGITGSVLGRVESGDGNLDFKKLQILIDRYKMNLNYIVGGIGDPLINSDGYKKTELDLSVVKEVSTEYGNNELSLVRLKLEWATKEMELYKKLYEKSEEELALLKHKK